MHFLALRRAGFAGLIVTLFAAYIGVLQHVTG